MARIETDPNYSTPTFSRATAATDLFKKEDVQNLAAAFSTHIHDASGKGLAVVPGAGTINGSAIIDATITSAKIQDGTVTTLDLAGNAVTIFRMAVGGSANPTTTSTTMVDLPECTLTFTPTVVSNMLLMFTGTFYCTVAGALGTYAINVDGSDSWLGTVGAPLAGTGGIYTVTLSYMWTAMTAASHVVKVRWSTSTGTATANQTQRNLTVLEFHR